MDTSNQALIQMPGRAVIQARLEYGVQRPASQLKARAMREYLIDKDEERGCASFTHAYGTRASAF